MARINVSKTKKIINVWEKKGFGNNIAFHERRFFPDLLRIAKSSEIILEVGVGTGRMIKVLLENDVQPIFCSIDLVIRSSIPKNFVVADARRLPFKEDAFTIQRKTSFPNLHFETIEEFLLLKSSECQCCS